VSQPVDRSCGRTRAWVTEAIRTGRWAGGSTGTNLWGVWQLVARMRAAGVRGSVVTLICDGGDRYQHSYYDDAWVQAQGMDLAPFTATLEQFFATGEWAPPA
jgi:cysteine synthase